MDDTIDHDACTTRERPAFETSTTLTMYTIWSSKVWSGNEKKIRGAGRILCDSKEIVIHRYENGYAHFMYIACRNTFSLVTTGPGTEIMVFETYEAPANESFQIERWMKSLCTDRQTVSIQSVFIQSKAYRKGLLAHRLLLYRESVNYRYNHCFPSRIT